MDSANVSKDTNIFARVWKGLKSEWMKIIFPSSEQILKDSVTVLVCSVIIGLLIFVLDSIIGSGFGFLFNR